MTIVQQSICASNLFQRPDVRAPAALPKKRRFQTSEAET